VILHKNFKFSRPLTVTGAYLYPNGEIVFHQMTLDRVKKRNYVLQNTMMSIDTPLLRIKRENPYYVTDRHISMTSIGFGKPSYNVDGISMDLVNKDIMETNWWYLLPQAYALTLSLV